MITTDKPGSNSMGARQPKLISVRSSLLLSMLSLVLLVAFGLLIAVQLNAARVIRQLSGTIIEAQSAQVEAQLTAFFTPVEVVLEAAASALSTGRVDPQDPAAMRHLLAPLLGAVPQISCLKYADSQGEAYELRHLETGWVSTETSLSRWPARARRTQWNDPAGAPVDQSWETGIADPRDSHWYQGGLTVSAEEEAGDDETTAAVPDMHWTDAYAFQTAADPGITGSKRLRRAPEQDAVLAADLLIARLDEYTDNLRPTPHGYVVVTDRRGKLLEPLSQNEDEDEDAEGAGSADEASRPAIETDQELMQVALGTWAARHGLDWAKIQDGTTQFGWDAELAGEQEVFQFHSRGQAWWGGMRVFSLSGDSSFCIAVLIPESDINRDIRSERQMLLLISALAVVLAVAFALTIASAFSSPLAALAKQSEAIRRLELAEAHPVKIRTHLKEIFRLSAAHASMSSALDSFSRYIPTELVRDLLARGEAARIGGKLMPLAVLISDIRGFTALCEATPAGAFTEQLAEYFDCTLSLLNQHQATIDKLVGDSVIAFWGAPQPTGDDPGNAVRAALDVADAIAKLNQGWAQQGRPALVTHFGLALGDVIVGNIGARWRLNYTAVGDAVNLASRLEGMNPTYGTCIIAARAFRDATANSYAWRLLDRVVVRGKQAPVEIYTPLGSLAELSAEQRDLAEQYEAAVHLLWQREFAAARGAMETLRSRFPVDKPVMLMLERLTFYEKHPPAWNWDGVHRGASS